MERETAGGAGREDESRSGENKKRILNVAKWTEWRVMDGEQALGTAQGGGGRVQAQQRPAWRRRQRTEEERRERRGPARGENGAGGGREVLLMGDELWAGEGGSLGGVWWGKGGGEATRAEGKRSGGAGNAL